jgi:hypothetical protein
MINKNLIYNDVLFHKIRNSSSILSIDKDNHYNFEIEEKNLKIKNVTYDEVLKEVKDGNKFDFIISYDLFSQDDSIIETCLNNFKDILSINGYIIIINMVLTSYAYYLYHPFSYVQRCLLGKPIYFSVLDDTIRNFGYKIKNIDRLYSIDLLSYPIEFFSVIIGN